MLLSKYVLLFKYQSQKMSIWQYMVSTQCETRLAEVLPKYYDAVPWIITSNSLSVEHTQYDYAPSFENELSDEYISLHKPV